MIQAFLFEFRLLQNYGSRFSHYSTLSQKNVKNSVLADYLIGSLKFSKDKALSFSSSYLRVKSLEKPQEVVRFFKGLGLSDARIQSIARSVPSLLFADVEKTLKPKVLLLQELGLSSLIFRNPSCLTVSPKRSLKPSITLIKKLLQSDGRCRDKEQVNRDLLRIMTRCRTIGYLTSRLQGNILYLESLGVVGSQLSTLLLNRSRLFVLPREKLEEVVSRAVALDFDLGSRMLAHAISVLSCASIKTLNGRFEVLMKFGFSKDELASMFRKSPHTFALCEAHLRRKVEYFLNHIRINRSVLVGYPRILCCSLEGRVIPRYNVLEILMSRKLLGRDYGLQKPMSLSDKQFLEKYILPYKNEVGESLLAMMCKTCPCL